MDHILGHETSLNKFERIHVIQSMFSDHSGTKLEFNYRKILKVLKHLRTK